MKLKHYALILSLLGASWVQGQTACPALDEAQLQAWASQCSGLAVGQVCRPEAEPVALPEDGVEAPALVRLSAGLTLALLGDARLQSVESPTPEVTVINPNNYEVNLRQGAGRNFALVGTLAANASVQANAQNADGTWLRLSDGAWVFAELVSVEGDLSALPVLEDSANASPTLASYQLISSASACAESGILFSTRGEAQLTLNEIALTWNASSAFVQALPEGGLRISVNQGEVTATLAGEAQVILAGQEASLSAEGVERSDSADLTSLPFALLTVAEGTPADVVYRYLEARTRSSAADMQALSCSAWDSQAVIQSQSFRAMNAELKEVNCSASSADETRASVTCEGFIQTTYNGQTREWKLGGFELVREEDEWRICGEAD